MWRSLFHHSSLIIHHSLVAAALMTEMGVKESEFVTVRAECLRTLARMQQQISQEMGELIAEFWETYLPLDAIGEAQLEQEVTDLLPQEGESKMPYMNMWMRKGYAQGALETKQGVILTQLRTKFGRLNEAYQERVAQLSDRQLDRLSKALLKFSNKSELDGWLQKYAPMQPADN